MRTLGTALLLLLLIARNTQCFRAPCKLNAQQAREGHVLEDGSLNSTVDGALYLNGTFWMDQDKTYWTCPCLRGKNCIRICLEGNLYSINLFACLKPMMLLAVVLYPKIYLLGLNSETLYAIFDSI
jgi:hypothetical protein